MTTRTLAALLVSTCLSAPAFAADLPVKAPPRAAPPVVADWTGFYLGIHGGYGWSDFGVKDLDLSEVGLSDPSPKGGVFGGQAGYLWQRGNFVGGLEIDYSFARLKDTQSVSDSIELIPLEEKSVAPVILTETLSLQTKVDALASARARAGFLIGPDFHVYATGGIGWARTKATVGFEQCILQQCESASASAVENNFGWVAGAGAEYRLWQNVSLGVTYLHYDFGTTNYAFSVPQLPITFSVKSDLTVDVVRGALNFRF